MTSTLETTTRAQVESLMAKVTETTIQFRDSENGDALTLATRNPLVTGEVEYTVISGTGGSTVTILSKTVDLTAAQIKTLNSVPVTSGLALPGATNAYYVIGGYVKFNYGTVAFDNTSLDIIADTATSATAQATAAVLDLTASGVYLLTTSGGKMIANKTIKITSNDDSTATGDSTATVTFFYSTQDLS